MRLVNLLELSTIAMALIQMDRGIATQPDFISREAIQLYNEKIAILNHSWKPKNHDYGEAWRDMRVSSLTDLIIQKLLRVKQIRRQQREKLLSLKGLMPIIKI